MKAKIIIFILIFAISANACGTTDRSPQNVTNPEVAMIETEDDLTYQNILDEYEQKLKNETLNIVEEYNIEYKKVSDSANDMLELAESKWNKILAIDAEGVDKMNELMRKNGDALTICQEWADKLNNCCKEQQKILQTAYTDSLIANGINPETLEKEVKSMEMSGRGKSDSGRSEPNYVGITGYAVVSQSQEHSLENTDEFTKTPWMVSNAIEHKTEVTIKSQDLKHQGWGTYHGTLTAKRTDNGEKVVINVANFITKPYWTYSDLTEAAKIGHYIAKYHQVSNYYPVGRNNDKVELEDGMNVLVVGVNHLSSRSNPDNKIYTIEAIVFKEWQYGYSGVDIYFNLEDLTLVY